MKPDKELCMKFPATWRDKLLNGEIEFPDDTSFEYVPIKTYRAVERRENDHRSISLDDFKSYFELNKKPRGIAEDPAKKPEFYGVSSFLKKEIVEQLMKFPNPKKKMAVGHVYCEGGPQYTNDQHVCWWLYDGADVSEFKLMEGTDNE